MVGLATPPPAPRPPSPPALERLRRDNTMITTNYSCRSSEASLGPPRWLAGLGPFLRAAGWLGSGPRLASRGRGCAAMSARWWDGAAGCHGERRARWACRAGYRVPGPDLSQRLRADLADQCAGGGVLVRAPGVPVPLAGVVPPARG